MEHGGKKIRKIQLYKCGYCINKEVHILRKRKGRKLKFPALVVRMEHETYGNILLDTGYSLAIYQNGIISWLYQLLNRTYVTEEDTIVKKLQEEGIQKVDKIILSHAHPDHIGGLNFFSNYELIATEETLQLLEKSKLRDLVFQNMLPKTKFIKKNVEPYLQKYFLKDYFDEVYDILGDSSIFGIRIEGHTRGQMGIYLPEYQLLFAADSSWGADFMEQVEQMKKIPQWIQWDFQKYKENMKSLQRLQKEHPEIEIIFSHGEFEEKVYDR